MSSQLTFQIMHVMFLYILWSPCTANVIVLLILQDKTTPLIVAVRNGHTNTFKELLSSGAIVNLADKVSTWKCVSHAILLCLQFLCFVHVLITDRKLLIRVRNVWD